MIVVMGAVITKETRYEMGRTNTHRVIHTNLQSYKGSQQLALNQN